MRGHRTYFSIALIVLLVFLGVPATAQSPRTRPRIQDEPIPGPQQAYEALRDAIQNLTWEDWQAAADADGSIEEPLLGGFDWEAEEGQIGIREEKPYAGLFAVKKSLIRQAYDAVRRGQRCAGAPHAFFDDRSGDCYFKVDYVGTCDSYGNPGDPFWWVAWKPKGFPGEVLWSLGHEDYGWARASGWVGPDYPTCWSEKNDYAELEQHYAAWVSYMDQLGKTPGPYWPGTTDPLPEGWRAAVRDSRFLTILPLLNACLAGAVGMADNPPMTPQEYILRGIWIIYGIVAATMPLLYQLSMQFLDALRQRRPEGFCPRRPTPIENATVAQRRSVALTAWRFVRVWTIKPYKDLRDDIAGYGTTLNAHHIVPGRFAFIFGYAGSDYMPAAVLNVNPDESWNAHDCISRAIERVLPNNQLFTKEQVCVLLPTVYRDWAPIYLKTVDDACK